MSIGCAGRPAGDGVRDFGLRLARGLADAPPLDPAELPDVRPGLADTARVTDAGVLGGVGQGPEDAPFIAPVSGFGWGVHDDGEAGAPRLPRSLLPDRQGRQHGWVRDQRQQRGKRRGQCRLPARADCL